jgi:predicted chitinase
MSPETLKALRELGKLLEPKYNLLTNAYQQQMNIIEDEKKKKESKPKLGIKFISINQNASYYLITFTIESKNLLNRKGYIFLNDAVNSENISFVEIKITQNNFSQEFKFPKNSFKEWSAKAIAKIDFLDISAESKQIPLIVEKKTCYCNRDFTVDEMQTIVEGIRDNTFYNNKPISEYHGVKLFHRNNDTKTDYNKELVKEKDQNFNTLTELLNKYFKSFKINKCIQKIHFLAQMYTETEYFTKTIEGNKGELNYDPYRGRGFMHLTDIKNYTAFKKDTNIDILDPNYNKVSTNLDIAAHTAAWFWSVRGKVEFTNKKNNEKYKDILGLTVNELSLHEDKYIDRICKIINGGNNAIEQRKTNYLTFKNILEYEICTNKK